MGATKRKARSNGRGQVTAARHRAVELARTGMSDDEIAAVLRHEFASEKPYKVLRTHLESSMVGWIERGLLADARVAGRAKVLEVMHKATDGVAVPIRGSDGEYETVPTKDSVSAATQLLRRQEHLEGLDSSIRKELERLLGMDAKDIQGELEKLGVTLRSV